MFNQRIVVSERNSTIKKKRNLMSFCLHIFILSSNYVPTSCLYTRKAELEVSKATLFKKCWGKKMNEYAWLSIQQKLSTKITWREARQLLHKMKAPAAKHFAEINLMGVHTVGAVLVVHKGLRICNTALVEAGILNPLIQIIF